MKKYIITSIFLVLFSPFAYCINTPHEYMNKILENLNQQNFSMALINANEFVQMYPTNTFSYMYRARIQQKIFKNYVEAIADYDKAIQYNHIPQENPWLYISKGECYALLGKHTEALEQYNLVPLNYIKETNNEIRLNYYELRASSEFSLELFGAVIKDCSAAIDIKAKPILYLQRAMAYIGYNMEFQNFEKDLRTATALCQYQKTAECDLINRISSDYNRRKMGGF